MSFDPAQTHIGFIGLGVMGRSMAQHLLDAGYQMHVFTRTKSSADAIVAAGATWHDSIADLAPHCDIVITIVGFPQDVEQVYLSNDGIIAHAKNDAYLIDMTTSSPALAKQISEAGAEKNLHCVDAPVSGGDVGAREARLSIMIGGEAADVNALKPIFECMGENIVHQGPAGAGQHCKMANQIAIASGMIGVCEALAYCEKAGLDQTTVLKSIGAGAAASWSLNTLGPRIIDGNFDPGFFIKHFIKDMKIAADSSSDMQFDAKGLALALSLYEAHAANGGENEGTQALYKLIANS